MDARSDKIVEGENVLVSQNIGRHVPLCPLVPTPLVLNILLRLLGLESSVSGTDGKEEGTKGFLLPTLFPMTTPLNSPRDISPGTSEMHQLPRKVHFQYTKSNQPDVSNRI